MLVPVAGNPEPVFTYRKLEEVNFFSFPFVLCSEYIEK